MANIFSSQILPCQWNLACGKLWLCFGQLTQHSTSIWHSRANVCPSLANSGNPYGHTSKPWAIYGTLQQCYIEHRVTNRANSVHRHAYHLYNPPIALLQYSHSSPIALLQYPIALHSIPIELHRLSGHRPLAQVRT